MKKLSVLMAALTCLTVGGVYAAWTYTGTTEASPDSFDKGIQLQTYTSSAIPGTFEIIATAEDEQKGLFYFDSAYAQENDTTNPHDAVLVTACTIEIRFTPSDVASTEIRQYGLAADCAFDISKTVTDWTFEGKNILKGTGTDVNVENTDAQQFVIGATNGNEAITWTEVKTDESAVYPDYFSYTMDAAQVATCLGVTENDDVAVADSTAWTNFQTAIADLNVHLYVTQQA